ncbi:MULTISPECIES: ABC transporter permease [Haloferax]|uniref:ABC transporter permease subunit n=2 Tax=Haloferax TaxID=2251 RepID=A0A6G1Z5Z8_9EURY|nr:MULTISPECIES: ABC transporter permease [Haloferax]KAB1185326.1 ABC transporter permease [Haloferax sp. CBA1149]MRW81962.1 ABC transporter permease subunit [Haloferax marinisediminis]
MAFRNYLAKRLVGTAFSYLVIATMIFFMFRQIGDPLGLHISPNMSPQQVTELKEVFGLNDPWYVQYFTFLKGLVTFNWGISFYYMESTYGIVTQRLFNSLLLTLPAILIGYIGGILGGIYLGWKRGQPSERLGMIIALLFRSTPRFWVGILLIFVFGAKLGLFPMSGMLSPGSEFGGHLELLVRPDFYWHAALPIASMTLYLMGLPLLLMRTSMLEVINMDFVDLIRAKGASEQRVMYRHVARNAMLPVSTAFAVAIGFSFGGNVLVETVFSYPGIGRLMVNSVFRGDYPVAQFSFLIMAAVVLVMNLVADIAYGYLDPRVSYE